MRLGLLFGSSARGTADEQSDVDVAIDVRGAADRLNISAQLSAALGQEVDLVVLGDVGVPLLDELVRDGIVAYEASPYAGARWRTRALIELETDRPWYGRMRDAWLARVAARGSTMVNRNIVAAKLTDLAARVARVRAHRKASSAELTADADAFDLVAFNLMLSVQILPTSRVTSSPMRVGRVHAHLPKRSINYISMLYWRSRRAKRWLARRGFATW